MPEKIASGLYRYRGVLVERKTARMGRVVWWTTDLPGVAHAGTMADAFIRIDRELSVEGGA